MAGFEGGFGGGFNPNILLGGARPVQAPDMGEALSLRAMSDQSDMRRMQLQQHQQEQASIDAANRVLPGLVAAKFAPDAVNAALQQEPLAAPHVLKLMDARRKSQTDEDKSRAEINEKNTNARAKALTDVGNAAFAEAQKPDNLSLSRVQYIAKQYGMPLPDFAGDPQNPQHVQQYLGSLGKSVYAVKDQVSNAQTREHNLSTENNQSLDRDQRLVIANKVDARARDFNAAHRDQAAATREAGAGKRTQDMELKIGDDYRAQSKAFQETARSINIVRKSLETATTNPGSALAAGTAFMKILDPNSVVRESELGMALNASGWFDRATNVAQTLMSGKVMTTEQAKNLRAASDALFTEAAGTQRQVDAQYGKRVKDYGGDPSRVILDLGQNQVAPPQGGGGGQMSASLPDPAKLPDGTRVRDTQTGEIKTVRNGRYTL